MGIAAQNWSGAHTAVLLDILKYSRILEFLLNDG